MSNAESSSKFRVTFDISCPYKNGVPAEASDIAEAVRQILLEAFEDYLYIGPAKNVSVQFLSRG